MLKFWKEVGKTNAIRQEVGKLTGDDSGKTILCSAGAYGSAGASLSMGDLNNGTVTPFWVNL